MKVDIPAWLYQTGLSLGILILSYLAARLTHYVLKTWAPRFARFTASDLDDRLLEAVNKPVYYIVILIGLYITISRLPLNSRIKASADGLIFIMGVIIAVVMAYKVVDCLIEWYASSMASKTGSTVDNQLIPLAEKVVNIFILTVGLITILRHFGYDVLSLITALGVGSLAIGLAAKETLTNMLSGFTIMMDRPFRINDRIEISGGQIGTVMDIGLRSTKILTGDQSVLVVPNSELVNTRVINLSYPDARIRNRIFVGIAYDNDVEKAKRLMKESALSIPSVLKDPAPDVFLTKLGDSSIELTMIYMTDNFMDRVPSQDAIHMSMLKRFKEEGIEIPFPTRVVYTRES